MPGLEGAHALEGDPANLETLALAGVRTLGLAHFSSNPFAPCAYGVGADNSSPLPAIGHELLQRASSLGVLPDLAHVGRQAFLDAAACAQQPVIVSHSGIRGAYDHWRNAQEFLSGAHEGWTSARRVAAEVLVHHRCPGMD